MPGSWYGTTTGLFLACIASTAGACTVVAVVAAAGNTAISAADNNVVSLNQGGELEFDTTCIDRFAIDVAINVATIQGNMFVDDVIGNTAVVRPDDNFAAFAVNSTGLTASGLHGARNHVNPCQP